MALKILKIDPYLADFEQDLNLRMENYRKKREQLCGKSGSLVEFANAHQYFGFHRTAEGWVYREWAPAAEKMFLAGDFNGWSTESHPLKRLEHGVFELTLPADALWAGCKVQAIVIHKGNLLRRIPLYATRVVQDRESLL